MKKLMLILLLLVFVSPVYSAKPVDYSDDINFLIYNQTKTHINQITGEVIVSEKISYPSSLNDILDLDAKLVLDDEDFKQPILVIMHGYGGSYDEVFKTGERLADFGLFVILVNMRGPSLGIADDSMYELFDIYDAVQHVLDNYDGLDSENINILGYSGGGGNTMQILQKFPDLFNNAYAFFGIANYCDGNSAEDLSWYLYTQKPVFRQGLERGIGDGTSDLFGKYPNRCLARNSLKQIPNNKKTNIKLFADEEDEITLAAYSQAYFDLYKSHGLDNVYLNISRKGDNIRFYHVYPEKNPAIFDFERRMINDIFRNNGRDISIGDEGVLNVGGYVKTEDFSIFLGDEIIQYGINKGREGLARVEYRIDDLAYNFFIEDKSYGAPFIEKINVILYGFEPNSLVTYSYRDGEDFIEKEAKSNSEGDLDLVIPLNGNTAISVAKSKITDRITGRSISSDVSFEWRTLLTPILAFFVVVLAFMIKSKR